MVLTQFGQGWLQQDEVAKLLMENGVAPGHNFQLSRITQFHGFQGPSVADSCERRKENRFCDGSGSGKLLARLVRLFVFKPDGIGDFILVTGALRTACIGARRKKSSDLCSIPDCSPGPSTVSESAVIELPTAAERKTVNLFARNLFYCLPLWFKLRMTRLTPPSAFEA